MSIIASVLHPHMGTALEISPDPLRLLCVHAAPPFHRNQSSRESHAALQQISLLQHWTLGSQEWSDFN